MRVDSFGTILLRPYYLVIGLPTTVAAWLMHRNDLLKSYRFFSTEALLWCVTLVGFASIVRLSMSGEKWSRTVLLTALIVIAALSASAQLVLVPWYFREAYLLHSTTVYSLQERQEADALFARYGREGKPDQPVVASTLLFRYALDRSLFWLNRLHNQPAPIWILGDTADPYPL